MIWRGSSPIVVGEVDDDGKVIEKLVINPGERIPEKWLRKMKAQGGADMIGQEDPLDMEGVQRAYKNKWRREQ